MPPAPEPPQPKKHGLGWWGRIIGAWAMVVVGVVGLVIPIIPGIPLLLGGLALLAPDYPWARTAMHWIKDRFVQLKTWWRGRKAQS